MSEYLRLGYVMDRDIRNISEEDAKMLTHVNLAFGLLKDGLIDMSWLTNIAYMDKLREYNPALKVVVSVGGWGAGGFSTMAMTKERRAAFVKSAAQAVIDYKLDGVDIDWEYPCIDAANIDADPKDKQNFTYLMQDLRDNLKPETSVSIAAGAGMSFIDATEMDKVGKACDYVQIMTYDMRGADGRSGHHSGLYKTPGDPNPNNTADCVDMMINAGVPKEKIVIGSAFYAHTYKGIKSVESGPVQPMEGRTRLDYKGYEDLRDNFFDGNGFKYYWDDDAKAPYLYNGDIFVTFDDERAVTEKSKYTKEKGLLGIMYWAHGRGSTPLLKAMYNELK